MSAPGLESLRARLEGGVLRAVRRSRPSLWQDHDTEALRDPVFEGLARPLESFGRAEGVLPDEFAACLAELARRFAARRELLLAALFSPGPLLDRLAGPGGRPGNDAIRTWVSLCWIFEAAWLWVERSLDAAGDTGGAAGDRDARWAAGDRDLLRPVVTRHRFLALSEPQRHRGERHGPWVPQGGDRVYGEHGLLGRAFGRDSWHGLVGRCRQARWTWLRCLDEHESHPLLAQARPGELETELAALVFSRERGWRKPPLVLSWKPVGSPATATAEDTAVMAEVIDRHLLPRFRLGAVARLAAHGGSRHDRAARWAATATSAVAGVAALALTACRHFAPAAWAAGACYLLLTLGAVALGRIWAAQWLLRLPAASAVGLLVLLTLPPNWWSTARLGWTAPAVLAGAALGYLLVEARNHGVSPRAAPARALTVTAAGAAHALLVSLVGLVLVAPAYVQDGPKLAGLWRDGAPGGQPWAVLALASAWCLAVGVFSQILWDDRPITAPLAHLQWRRGR